MKILSIDYGKKRIGIAISDEMGEFAFPKCILLNNSDLLKNLNEIIKLNCVKEIVIGESVDLKGKLNTISKDIENFILKLKKSFNLPIHKQKEFLTSVESINLIKTLYRKNRKKLKENEKKKYIDDISAALILQRYLDRINKNNV